MGEISFFPEDLKIIKTTGLNTIRVFVPYEDFGKANINPEKLEKLKQLLKTLLDARKPSKMFKN